MLVGKKHMPSVTNLLWPTVLDVAMDLLVDLLTYDCPYSGRKRVAGQYDEGIETEPTTKLPSCSVFFDVSTDFLSFQFA